MIPEGHVSLDSILEGILDDETDTGGPPTMPASSSSSNGLSSPSTGSSSFDSDNVVSPMAVHHDPIPGIPCISIKTELPDSCSMDIMVRFECKCVLKCLQSPSVFFLTLLRILLDKKGVRKSQSLHLLLI